MSVRLFDNRSSSESGPTAKASAPQPSSVQQPTARPVSSEQQQPTAAPLPRPAQQQPTAAPLPRPVKPQPTAAPIPGAEPKPTAAPAPTARPATATPVPPRRHKPEKSARQRKNGSGKKWVIPVVIALIFILMFGGMYLFAFSMGKRQAKAEAEAEAAEAAATAEEAEAAEAQETQKQSDEEEKDQASEEDEAVDTQNEADSDGFSAGAGAGSSSGAEDSDKYKPADLFGGLNPYDENTDMAVEEAVDESDGLSDDERIAAGQYATGYICGMFIASDIDIPRAVAPVLVFREDNTFEMMLNFTEGTNTYHGTYTTSQKQNEMDDLYVYLHVDDPNNGIPDTATVVFSDTPDYCEFLDEGFGLMGYSGAPYGFYRDERE